MTETVIVAKNPKFIDFLLETGILAKKEKYLVKEYVVKDDIINKRVIGGGRLPMRIKRLMKEQIIVYFRVPDEKRNKELTLEEMHQYFNGATQYTVHSFCYWKRNQGKITVHLREC